MGAKVKQKHFWNTILFLLSFGLLAFYLIIGYYIMFTDKWSEILPSGRNVIGFALISFAIIRFYVAYIRYKAKHKKISSTNQKKIDEINNVEES